MMRRRIPRIPQAQSHVLFALLLLVVLLVCEHVSVLAESGADTMYTVQSGDSLSAIAARFGADLTALQQLNGIQDPRKVYVGQELRLSGTETTAQTAYQVVLGDDLVSLAGRTDQSWTALAHINRLTHPGLLLVGQTLYLPNAPLSSDVVASAPVETRLTLALRHGASYWQTLRLNPQPFYVDAVALIPADGVSDALGSAATLLGASTLPYPVAALSMTAQPVARGQTVLMLLDTVTPASCTVTYLDVTEPCYAQSETRLFAPLGFPPLLEPSVYDVEVYVRAIDSTAVATDSAVVMLTVSIHVAPGRYDFERIDLPPDRQSLLDPTLSAQERAKIVALRTVRSPERLWEFPFHLPVESSVTSYYGSRRSYGYGFGSFHGGTDFQAERGMPFYAPASGVVVLAEPLVVRGNAVVIDHGWGVVTGYWHLSRIDVEVGQTVVQGEQVGLIGNTGLSTGPHLHWEMWANGVSVSPLQWVSGFDTDAAKPASAVTAVLRDE